MIIASFKLVCNECKKPYHIERILTQPFYINFKISFREAYESGWVSYGDYKDMCPECIKNQGGNINENQN